MKIYLACTVTEGQDLEINKQIVDYLHSKGHKVLDEHVAYENHREVFQKNAGVSFDGKPQHEIENIIRDQDFRWLEETEAFIGFYFDPSFGTAIEFEHLRFLIKLSRTGRLVEPITEPKLFLCVFLRDGKRSAMIHGIDLPESSYIKKLLVSNKSEVFDAIRRWL